MQSNLIAEQNNKIFLTQLPCVCAYIHPRGAQCPLQAANRHRFFMCCQYPDSQQPDLITTRLSICTTRPRNACHWEEDASIIEITCFSFFTFGSKHQEGSAQMGWWNSLRFRKNGNFKDSTTFNSWNHLGSRGAWTLAAHVGQASECALEICSSFTQQTSSPFLSPQEVNTQTKIKCSSSFTFSERPVVIPERMKEWNPKPLPEFERYHGFECSCWEWRLPCLSSHPPAQVCVTGLSG